MANFVDTHRGLPELAELTRLVKSQTNPNAENPRTKRASRGVFGTLGGTFHVQAI